MKHKAILKIVVDTGMTVMLLFLMTYELIGEAAHSPYFKPEMDPECFQREIYIVPYLADGSCYWNPSYNGWLHV